MFRSSYRGFSLIELIVVVAILAILVAIAVPNLVEAQVRAKLTRVKSEMRTLVGSLEAYAVDFGDYPYPMIATQTDGDLRGLMYGIRELTTPVSYLTTVGWPDPFSPDWKSLGIEAREIPWRRLGYQYRSYAGHFYEFVSAGVDANITPFRGYGLISFGPDRQSNAIDRLPLFIDSENDRLRRLGVILANQIYDPTNGSASQGDIMRWEGKNQTIGRF